MQVEIFEQSSGSNRKSRLITYETPKKPSFFENAKPIMPDWITKEWIMYKGVLGAVGLVAGAISVLLFLEPSKSYAENEKFGIELTEEFGFPSRWIFFISALFYIGTINSYSVSTVSEKIPDFFKQMSNNLVRLFAGIALLAFIFVQLIQPYSAARGTGSSLFMALLATFGFFPMTLYVGINAAKEDLPWIFYNLNSLRIWLQENTFERLPFLRPNQHVVEYRRQRKALENICELIKQQAKDGWLVVLKDSRRLDFSDITLDSLFHEKLQFLLRKSSKQARSNSPLTFFIHAGLALLGVILLLPFFYADIKNLIRQMKQIFMLPLAVFFGASASVTLIYFTTTFICKFFIDNYDYFKNKPQDKAIDWLTYHLSPAYTYITTPFNIITPIFSFTVAEIIFRLNYDISEKGTVNYAAAWWMVVVSIVLYHMLGQMKIAGVILKDFLKAFGDDRQKALISLSSVVSEYKTPYHFAFEVNEIQEADRQLLLGDKSEDFKDAFDRYKEAARILRTAPCCSWRRTDEEAQNLITKTPSGSNVKLYDSMGK